MISEQTLGLEELATTTVIVQRECLFDFSERFFLEAMIELRNSIHLTISINDRLNSQIYYLSFIARLNFKV